MSDTAIKVEGLSKRYRIGAQQQAYRTLREKLNDTALAPFRAARHLLTRNGGNGQMTEDGRPKTVNGRRSSVFRQPGETFWALKDVSFEVKRGEVVGIIGRNGAGKSTLLKILSRITEPTEGYADINGRIASLLEVGTGFHPELTGRENIFLNGSILGMKRVEIKKKFDEIVAFAEISKFIDTPVKHYSSGMYVRLAFAVAAHLDPEILMVDEVLAVGDASFQRKCLDKMKEVSHVGRTVLFVSHNMPAITRLCERAILLDEGRLRCEGSCHEVVGEYLRAGFGTSAQREWRAVNGRPGNDIVRLRGIRVRDQQGTIAEKIDIRTPVAIEMEFDVLKAGHVLIPNLHFHNEEGVNVFIVSDQDLTWRRQPRLEGRYKSIAWIPGNLLAEGSLIVSAAISTMDPVRVHFYERDVVAFQIVDSLDGNSARGDFAGPMPGIVRPLLEWKTEFAPRSSFSLVDDDEIIASLA